MSLDHDSMVQEEIEPLDQDPTTHRKPPTEHQFIVFPFNWQQHAQTLLSLEGQLTLVDLMRLSTPFVQVCLCHFLPVAISQE